MKRRDVERHLQVNGARPVREGGNHRIWKSKTGSTSSVPRHSEIKPGVVRAICRQLALPDPPGR